jgi:hypothetical protein
MSTATADYARATMFTSRIMADPSASPMDRYLAAEAEEAACLAAREAEAAPELEAGA